MKIVTLKPIEDITHRKQLFKRFLCEDNKGIKYITFSLFGNIPTKGIQYSQSHGVLKVITL